MKSARTTLYVRRDSFLSQLLMQTQLVRARQRDGLRLSAVDRAVLALAAAVVAEEEAAEHHHHRTTPRFERERARVVRRALR